MPKWPYNQLEYFINVITHKVKNKVRKDNNINCIKILQACKKSYQTSSKVTVKYGNGFRNYENVVEAIKNNYFNTEYTTWIDFGASHCIDINDDTLFKYNKNWISYYPIFIKY